ncbi:MAG: protein kinase domain-containing protein, partial [Vicinamibacterales bacterium]
MAPDARQRVNEILEAALRRPPHERRQYVASRCGDDVDLRQKIDRLLAATGDPAGDASEAAMSPVSIDRTRSAHGVDGGSFAPDAPQPVLAPGSFVGPYAIASRLGIGGMGEVYLARDTRLHRDVAIKLLPPAFASDAGRRIRFEHEARAVASLNHSNIVSVHDVGVNDGMPYIVMEYVRGETLSAQLRREPLSCARALQVASEIAEALVEAHAHHVVHRDLKPSNVMVTPDGLVKVVDFGIAKTALAEPPPAAVDDASHDINWTQPGQLIGTPGYMSPEQLLGGFVDHWTDIYSLGVILFELLTGQLPFPGDDLVALREAALTLPPPRASDIDPAMPAAVSDLIVQALSRDPSARPSAAVFRAELNALLARPALTRTGVPSVAVLSFSDMSPAKDHEFFCDGMAEELINALTQIPGLRIAARTSAFQFKGKIRDVRVIGDALNVATVVDGSVRKNGNRLRLTLELISTSDGFVLWSERFDGDLDDVFALQDEITRSVVAALRGRLVADKPRTSGAPRRTNVEAYRLYLEGRYHWNNRTEEELNKSVTCFERAIEVDPG